MCRIRKPTEGAGRVRRLDVKASVAQPAQACVSTIAAVVTFAGRVEVSWAGCLTSVNAAARVRVKPRTTWERASNE